MGDTSDVYSMPCGRAVLTLPAPDTMTDDDVSEVEQWLALVMRRLYRQHHAKGSAEQEVKGGDHAG